MGITPEFIEETLSSFFRRCELIRLAGGIALMDVVDRRATVPAGWHLVVATEYFVPPGLVLNDNVQ